MTLTIVVTIGGIETARETRAVDGDAPTLVVEVSPAKAASTAGKSFQKARTQFRTTKKEEPST